MVIADISGYTKFMSLHRLALIHAEVVITELLDAVTRQAKHPLKFNGLAGDAALLYCDELGDDPTSSINDIASQIIAMMDAFSRKHSDLVAHAGGGCSCVACQNINVLRLKAFAHVGDVVIKSVHGSVELGGEAPIVIHRLAKNNLDADEYVMVTDAFARYLNAPLYPHKENGTECYASLGDIDYVAYFPQLRDIAKPETSTDNSVKSALAAARLFMRGMAHRLSPNSHPFRNLPTQADDV